LRPEQSKPEDLELLRAIARKDENALGQLYDRYRVILFSLIARILHSREESEDVLQEVMLQVWRRAEDYDESRGRPFTWLVTLARSRAIDRLRSLDSRDRTATEAARTVVDQISDASDDALRSEQSEIVRRALAELPEDQRKTLVLAYYEGLTQAEIGTKLEWPLGTVKTRMRAGMIRLRELLGNDLDLLMQSLTR
jgi:RNA polymerase sigma-70 factor (ECF subfamily)